MTSLASVADTKLLISFNTSRFVQTNPSAGQSDVFDGETVAPVRNVVKTHKLAANYKLLPKLALSANIPYSDKSADIISTVHPDFRLVAKGLGDLNVSGNYQLLSNGNERFYVDFALSLPTGSVTLKNDTPFGEDQLCDCLLILADACDRNCRQYPPGKFGLDCNCGTSLTACRFPVPSRSESSVKGPLRIA